MERFDINSSKSATFIAGNTLLGYVLFSILFYLVYKAAGALLTDESGTILLDGFRFVAPLGLALIGGFLVVPLVRIFSPLWGSKETEKATGCSLGVVFASGICFGGGCIPAAAFGLVGALFLLVPFHVGVLASNLLLKKH